MSFDYRGRLIRLQTLMDQQGFDAAMFSVGADLPYFAGYEAIAGERLTMLVVLAEGDPVLLIPELEAPRVEEARAFDLVSWGETQDPISLVTKLVGDSKRMAIGDQTRSAFVLALQAAIPGSSWLPASQLTRGLRMRKDQAEIAALREVGSEADSVAGRIPSEIRFEGATEAGVSRQVQEMLLDEGHDHAEFAIVGSGPNGSSPHHSASNRVIEAGDIVVLDFGGRRRGYCSDTTRMFIVGDPTSHNREVHAVVAAAQQAAREVARPGVPCQEIDRAARGVINDAGYGEFFVHRTGHGIGLEVHEHPYIVEGNEVAIEAGMAFSIEPGIYLPGQFGVRLEDIVVATEGGVETFNNSVRDLVSVS